MTTSGHRPPGPAVGAGTALHTAVADWVAADPDPDTRAELLDLQARGAWDELAGRFSGRLSFGTAGLRAELGAGPMRMNRLVVRQAAAGLVRHLRELGCDEPLVVVGFDARHKSDCFAADTAAVIAAAGGRAVVFAAPGPTPLLAFALRRLGADAGVMVTASHNPPADNGYKVYLADGAQIVPPADAAIAGHIAAAGLDVPVAAADHPAITTLPDAVERAYLDEVVGQVVPGGRRDVRVAYTALHGVGTRPAVEAFAAAGFPPLHLVASQAAPDPDFPTVAFPNPEEAGALDAGLALAREIGADVLLANDPDADRLGVAVPCGTETGSVAPAWRVLTGNEIGVLLADHLLRHRDVGGERLVVTTIVSSRLLARIAADAGVHYVETLPGFKWIIRPALANPDWRFVLGYEEALGYSVGSSVRDKDGIAAALVFAELVATQRAEGRTVCDRLAELARRHGLHATVGFSLRLGSGSEGAARASAAVAKVRTSPPAVLGGRRVISVEDLADRPAPTTDALIWSLDDGGRVVLRPSGTEPKLKVYVEVVEPVPAGRDHGEAAAAAEARLAGLRADLEALLRP
jgi:phosphomannomutase